MNVLLKKPLNDVGRVRLFALAGARFVDAGKRKMAQKAKRDLFDSLWSDAKKFPKKEIETLGKYNMAHPLHHIYVAGPYENGNMIALQPAIDTITVDGGRTIERNSVLNVPSPRGSFNEPSHHKWSIVYAANRLAKQHYHV